MVKPWVHSHDDFPTHRTHQKTLTQITNKHGNGLFFCTSSQLRPGTRRKKEALHLCVQYLKIETLFSGENKPVASTEKGQNESFVGIFTSILQNRHQFWLCKSLWPPSVSQKADKVPIQFTRSYSLPPKH